MMNLVLKLKKVIKLQSFYRDSLQNIKKEMGFLVNVIYCLCRKRKYSFLADLVCFFFFYCRDIKHGRLHGLNWLWCKHYLPNI